MTPSRALLWALFAANHKPDPHSDALGSTQAAQHADRLLEEFDQRFKLVEIPTGSQMAYRET